MSQVKRSDTIFLWSFLIVGLAVQIVTYIISPQSVISLICGMLGICSVIVCSQGRILTYVFGFGQILTYTYICYTESLYGLIGINVYYFITQIYGIIIWRKRLQANNSELMDVVPTRKNILAKDGDNRCFYCCCIGVNRLSVSYFHGRFAAIFRCIYNNTCVGGADIDDFSIS